MIPIVYSEKFYKDVLDPLLDDVNKLSKYDYMMNLHKPKQRKVGRIEMMLTLVMAVYYADIPVGAICCKYENLSKGSKESPTLAVLTLA